MVNVLCNVHSGLKIFHFNARSLSGGKLDLIKYIFGKNMADVICVSETWFNSMIPDSMYSIEGYQLFRNDRINKRGGGVAIYCRTGLNAKILCKSKDVVTEYLCIEITGSVKIMISCVYNPHRLNSPAPFFDEINSRLVEYDFYVVCGDFNVNLLVNDGISSRFIDLIDASCLKPVNTSLATRFGQNVQNSLLDLFLVSDISTVVKYDQLPFISDHDLIFCCLDILTNNRPSYNTYTFYDYNNINYFALQSDLSNVSWSDCKFLASVDEKLDWFVCVVKELFELHVPLKTVKPKTNLTPWFNDDVLRALRLRNKSRSRWRNNPSDVNWSAFIQTRNAANLAIRNAKFKFFAAKLNHELPTKVLWKNIRKLKVYGNDKSKCALDPDLLNAHFSSIITPNISVPVRDSCEYNCFFEFSNVTEADVYQQIMSITSNAVGSDGISIRFIKVIAPFILPTLTHIFNHCFTTSTFPSLWKIATITPIPKKNNSQCPGDFRPINILPALSKILEKLMAQQINNYLSKYELLSKLQSGFRVGHSCQTAVNSILDDIRISYDMNQLTLLGLLDFSKAFDLVNHELLCAKLKYYFHFGTTAHNLMVSYLENRIQRVRVDQTFSTNVLVRSGVPQGSTLGPLLFVMFINDLLFLETNSNIHAYADDIQIYLSSEFNSRGDMARVFNNDLLLINSWSSDNGLILNASKCAVLPIYYKKFTFDMIPSIYIDNEPLNLVAKARCLGIFINYKLSCSDHVNSVVQKTYATLRCLRLTSSFTPTIVKRNLVLQLILPHINYFSIVYCSLDSNSSRKIGVLFNDAVRYVYGIRRYEHIGSIGSNIIGVSIFHYIDIRILVFFHRLIHLKIPTYLFTRIKICRSNRTAQFLVPSHCHLNSSRLFFVTAIRLWNSLPITLRNITGGTAFKKSLFVHYSSLI